MNKRGILFFSVFCFYIFLFGTTNSSIYAQITPITIVSPNPGGGDTCEIGNDFTIKWDFKSIFPSPHDIIIVFIRREPNGPLTPIDSICPFPHDPEKMVWNVTGPPSPSCQIEIAYNKDDPRNSGYGKMDDGKYFTILPPTYIKMADNVKKQKLFLKSQLTNFSDVSVFDLNGKLLLSLPHGKYLFKHRHYMKSGTYIIKHQNNVNTVIFK